jgi:hypothetical protein
MQLRIPFDSRLPPRLRPLPLMNSRWIHNAVMDIRIYRIDMTDDSHTTVSCSAFGHHAGAHFASMIPIPTMILENLT